MRGLIFPSPNFLITWCHPHTIPLSCSTTLQTSEFEKLPHLLTARFARLSLPWPLLDRVAQQLPPAQAQLEGLKPTFVTVKKRVLSSRIHVSHAGDEKEKESVVSRCWLKHCHWMAEKAGITGLEKGKKGILCSLMLPPQKAAGTALTLHFSLLMWSVH